MTRVHDVMSKRAFCCGLGSTLNDAAQIMWDHACGCVPIVDERSHVVGVLTDRDLSMAAYIQGKRLTEISAFSACSHALETCNELDSIAQAEQKMIHAQVRRLPVVDHEGVLIGMLSLSDLALHARSTGSRDHKAKAERSLAAVVSAVSRPRVATPGSELPTKEIAESIATFDAPGATFVQPDLG